MLNFETFFFTESCVHRISQYMCVVVQKEWVENEIRLINESKVSKEKDIPVKGFTRKRYPGQNNQGKQRFVKLDYT